MKSWRWIVLVSVLITSLLLSGCGVAASPSQSSSQAAEKVVKYAEETNRFALKLPPVYVQYNNDGVLGVAGITTNQLYQWTGIDVRGLNVQPWVVQRFVEANIQHIEIAEGEGGIAAYVNGEPLPYIAWGEESLKNLGELLPAFGVPYGQVVGKLLPLLRYTRLALVVQFPVAPGAELQPFRAPNAPAVTKTKARMMGEPVAVVRFDIAYDENGMPSLFGLDAASLRSLGIDLSPFALDANLVRSLVAANVQHVHFVNRPDGIHIFVNNKPLPYIAWDEQHVNTALELYGTLSGLGSSPVMTLLTQVLPAVRQSDVDLLLRFPVREGTEPIPVLEPSMGQ